MKEALTVDEVALRLNVERKTIYGMLKRGDLRVGRLNRSRTIARFLAPHYEGSFSDSPIEGGRGVLP
jgi:excisionase family DNA binding protein